jgi:hypothetical protein
MSLSIVDRLFGDFQELVGKIGTDSPSLVVTADEIFRKSLLLAAASYFELRVKDEVLNIVRRTTGNRDIVVELVRTKAVDRQYHTFFKWEGNNANVFFSMFGSGYSSFMKSRVAEDDQYAAAIKAFLEIGNDRNRLVHQDYGTFVLEKTADEIYQTYLKAASFVESLSDSFDQYLLHARESV